MKILVMSDSHRSGSNLEKAIESHPDAKEIIFLGDGEDEITNLSYIYTDRRFHIVAGNCDWGSMLPSTLTLHIGGKTIFATHGHLFGVKDGTDRAAKSAKQAGADVLLFGHTHIAFTDYKDGLYIMNPGSISSPRDFSSPSYGILEILPAGIITTIVR